MTTFVVRVMQVRKVDDARVIRRMVVDADDAVQAEELAVQYCAGYFQCRTEVVLEVRMLSHGTVMVYGDPQ